MILVTAAALTLLGVALFAMGLALERPELAMFGAIVMIGVGATGMVTGIQVESGSRTTVETTDASVPDLSFSNPSYDGEAGVFGQSAEAYGISGRSGSVLVSGDSFVRKYDVSNDVANATQTAELQTTRLNSTEDASEAGGTLVVASKTDDVVAWYNSSGGVGSASYEGSINATGATDVELSADGSRLVVTAGDGATEAYVLSAPYDPATRSPAWTANLSRSAPVEGASYGGEGLNLLVMSADGEADRFTSAEPYGEPSFSGDTFAAGSGATDPRGVAWIDDSRTAVVLDGGDEVIRAYDVTTPGSRTTRERQIQYEPLQVHTGFPLDVVLLLLGTVMLMASAGVASEAGDSTNPWE
jgi:hypothetical protein